MTPAFLLSANILAAMTSTALLGLTKGLVMLYAIFATLGRRWPGGEEGRKNLRDLACLLPFAAGLAWGVFISEDLANGLKEARTPLQFCLLPLFAELARRASRLNILAATVLAGGIELGRALYNASMTRGFTERLFGYRHPNMDGVFCMLFVLFAVYFLVRERGGMSLLWAAGIVLFLPLLVLTQSRASAITLVLLLPLVLWGAERSLLLIRLPLLAAFAALVLFAAPPDARERLFGSFSTAVSESSPMKSGTSMGTRYQLWKAALISFSETRGLGTGFGDYHNDLDRYRREGRIAPDIINDLDCHSIYLQALMCGGMLSLGGLMASLGLLIFRGFRRSGGINAAGTRLRLLVLLALMIPGLTDSYLDRSVFIFIYLHFWAVAACFSREEGVKPEKKPLPFAASP